MHDQLTSSIRSSAAYVQANATLAAMPKDPIQIAGVPGSLPSVLGALFFQDQPGPLCFVARDAEAAQRVKDDLSLTAGSSVVVMFDGQSSALVDAAHSGADLQALRALAIGTRCILVTHPRAFTVSLPPPDTVRERALSIEVGATYDLDQLRMTLLKFGFERKDVVETHGDIALRGGIVDVFPTTGESPIRIEFFGDTVESIRHFDPLSQRSIKELAIAVIVADLFRSVDDTVSNTATLASYLDPETLILLDEPEFIRAKRTGK